MSVCKIGMSMYCRIVTETSTKDLLILTPNEGHRDLDPQPNDIQIMNLVQTWVFLSSLQGLV